MRRIRRVILWSAALVLGLCLLAVLFYDLRPSDALAAGTRAEAEQTLIIDPGHGGMDGGAVAADGTLESGINLSICLRMADLSGLLGIPVSLTRTSEELDYPQTAETVREKKVWDQKSRAALIASRKNGVLISVHQNRYPDPRPSGAQVLYAAAVTGSRELAETVQRNLVEQLDPRNRRVCAPAGKDIYLMKTAPCPAVLVECGFLSNPAEAEKLKSDAYQRCIATVLICSYVQAMAESAPEGQA